MTDFLIVGGGMAGCNMAYRLISEGKTVMLLHDNDAYISSEIAAGIYNPLLPKHHKISYNAEHIYPGLEAYYKTLEEWLGGKVLHAQPVHYILNSNSEQNDWSALAYSSHIGHWVDVNTDKLNSKLRAPHGYLKIKHSGWVDTKQFLALSHQKLAELQSFRVEKFEHAKAVINAEGIQYKDINAKAIIYCEGIQVANNDSIDTVELKPAKGEILVIKTEMEIGYIAQQGVFMLPLGNDLYKVGSNFTWDPLDNLPTEEGRKEILSKLGLFFKGDYEVVEHYAGIRPSSTDRRPILGPVKPHGNCYVFNGLGSKGVALSSYYSGMLTQYILNGTPIDREVFSDRKLK